MRRCTVLFAITITMALARPPDEVPVRQRAPRPPRQHGPFGRFLLPRMMLPRSPLDSQLRYDWVSREIDRLNLMSLNPAQHSIPEEDENAEAEGPLRRSQLRNNPEVALPEVWKNDNTKEVLPEAAGIEAPDTEDDEKDKFALTPKDMGFNEPEMNPIESPPQYQTPPPYAFRRAEPLALPPRQARQNPNLGRARHLVAESLEMMRSSNTASDALVVPTSSTRYVRVEARPSPEAAYGVAVLVASSAALAIAVVGFAIGWYSLSKKAKAAASVDYPAYGVTGPAADATDRKLAQSAHMFHYQHQKQQILAMERGASERRDGSLSDPDSEEENEEGDYTVYECPGFASTGDMEVKNPMFSEDPTPATPGQCELVKPQPKE